MSYTNSTTEGIANVLAIVVINKPCESTFSIETEEINISTFIGLIHIGSIVIARKNRDITTRHEKISKDSI